MELSKPIVGVGAIIIENGKLLLVKRGKEPNKGFWSFPGGVVEFRETLEDALKREVKEETNLEIEVKDVACVLEKIVRSENGKDFHYIIIDFFAKVVDGEPTAGSDAEDVRWFDIDEIVNETAEMDTKKIYYPQRDSFAIVNSVRTFLKNFKKFGERSRIYISSSKTR